MFVKKWSAKSTVLHPLFIQHNKMCSKSSNNCGSYFKFQFIDLFSRFIFIDSFIIILMQVKVVQETIAFVY